jgi:AAA domain/Homeodomain-like domain
MIPSSDGQTGEQEAPHGDSNGPRVSKRRRTSNPFARVLLDQLHPGAVSTGNGGHAPWVSYPTIREAFDALGFYEQVIPNWVPASGVVLFVAEKGAGKTIAALDQALSLATDQDTWQGYDIKQGLFVVYLCGESQELTTAHAMAWCHEHDVDPADARTRFLLLPRAPALLNEHDVDALIAHLRERIPSDMGAVIYIDTLQRAISGTDPNDFKTMSVVMENAEKLGKALHAPVIVIAHPAKGKKGGEALGSSVFGNDNAAQWEITCIGSDGKPVKCSDHPKAERRIRVTRYKGSDSVETLRARLHKVPIGFRDDFGQERTGGVLQQAVCTEVRQEPSEDERAAKAKAKAAEGWSERKIAEDLGVSRHQVRKYLDQAQPEPNQ